MGHTFEIGKIFHEKKACNVKKSTGKWSLTSRKSHNSEMNKRAHSRMKRANLREWADVS